MVTAYLFTVKAAASRKRRIIAENVDQAIEWYYREELESYNEINHDEGLEVVGMGKIKAMFGITSVKRGPAVQIVPGPMGNAVIEEALQARDSAREDYRETAEALADCRTKLNIADRLIGDLAVSVGPVVVDQTAALKCLQLLKDRALAYRGMPHKANPSGDRDGAYCLSCGVDLRDHK